MCVTYEDNICKYNCIEHGGNSICLLRGQTRLREKLGLAQNRGEESMSEFPAPESCTELSHQHLCQCIHNASCPLPFTHSWFASNLNGVILTFILVSDLCVHLSQPSWFSPFISSFPTILSHPRFVSVSLTFPPGSFYMEHGL